MAEDMISAQPLLPYPLGVIDAQTQRYLITLVEALIQELSFLRTHLNTHTMQGTAAQRPAADGTRRFYWQTDGTPHLEYDSGTWNSV